METTYKHMPDICEFKHHPGTPKPKGCINKLNSQGPFPPIDAHWCLFTSQASRKQSCLAQRCLKQTMFILGLFLQHNYFSCSTVRGSWKPLNNKQNWVLLHQKWGILSFQASKIHPHIGSSRTCPKPKPVAVVNVTSIKTWLFHKQLRAKQAVPEKAEGFWLLANPSVFQGFNTSDTKLK